MILLVVSSVSFLFILVFQLLTGFAVIGLAGDEVLVDRRERPVQYWFSIGIQIFVAVMVWIGSYLVML